MESKLGNEIDKQNWSESNDSYPNTSSPKITVERKEAKVYDNNMIGLYRKRREWCDWYSWTSLSCWYSLETIFTWTFCPTAFTCCIGMRVQNMINENPSVVCEWAAPCFKRSLSFTRGLRRWSHSWTGRPVGISTCGSTASMEEIFTILNTHIHTNFSQIDRKARTSVSKTHTWDTILPNRCRCDLNLRVSTQRLWLIKANNLQSGKAICASPQH